jgi:hypothetical protein
LRRSEMVALGLGGVTFVVRWIQLDVLVGTAAWGTRVRTSGGLDIESANFRSSLLLSVLRPRAVLSSSLLTTTTIPDNSDFASPKVSRPPHDSGTVSLSHSSSSWDGTTGGFETARRNILCGDVKYGDSASEGGTGISTGFFGRRRELLRPTPDPNETGRERGVCDVGDGCGCVKDIMKPGLPV